MEIQIVDPLTCRTWDDIVLANKQYSFFHSACWANALRMSYGYTPVYYVFKKTGKVVAAVPVMEMRNPLFKKRGVTLPFTDYCPPLIDEGVSRAEVIRAIIDSGEQRGWKYWEFRGGNLEGISARPRSFYYIHWIDLQRSEREMFDTFKSNFRRNINRAIREGVAVERRTSHSALRKFYRLHCLTRKRHGLPPQPFTFFISVFESIIRRDMGAIYLAKYKGHTIAGAVFFHFGKRVVYKYGASNRKMQHLRANNIIMWEAIKWYRRHNYEYMSLGRTSAKNKGLLQFKDGLGGTRRKVCYYKYQYRKHMLSVEKAGEQFLFGGVVKLLPITVLRAIGSIVYKYLG